jgi:diguanylate cyclase (GGDEF)-like protein/PAS domain S-box-containing protein
MADASHDRGRSPAVRAAGRILWIAGGGAALALAVAAFGAAAPLAALPALLATLAAIGAVTLYARAALDDLVQENRTLCDRDARLTETLGAQWAALNALPAQVALIDRHGRILAVNRAWERHGAAQGFGPGESGIGASVIALCESETGPVGRDRVEIGAMLRAVASGEQAVRIAEYPGRWPTAGGWHRLVAARLDHPGEASAVVLQYDITRIKHVEIELKQKTISLQNITSGIPGIVYQLVKPRGGELRATFISAQAERMLGYQPDAMLVQGGALLPHIAHPDDRDWVTRSKIEFAAEAKDGDTWRAEFRVLTLAGEIRWVQAFARLTISETGDRVIDGVLLDVSEHRAAAEKLVELQHIDARTGLFNRQFLLGHVGAALKSYLDSGEDSALLIVEVREFADVVSTYGVTMADDLLRRIGERLVDIVRRGDTVASVEGARFGVLAVNIGGAENARRLAEKLAECAGGIYALPGQEVSVQVRVGVALADRVGRVPVEILRQAMVALNHVNADAGGSIALYADHMAQEPELRLRMRSALASALGRNELLLAYQPRIDLHTHRVVGCEALLRWQHPVFGLQLPGRFIAIAEQSGIIIDIGRWVIREACRQAAEWRAQGLDLQVSVNVSAVQLQQDHLPGVLAGALASAGLPASALQLEMTESTLVGADGAVSRHLAAIKDLGVTLSIDDFGTGYSSLSYLRDLPADVVKIDRAFITNAAQSESDGEIVRSIVSISRTLGLRVVAEGVENYEQLRFLMDSGIDEVQGFYLGRPMPPASFAGYERQFRLTDYLAGPRAANGI